MKLLLSALSFITIFSTMALAAGPAEIQVPSGELRDMLKRCSSAHDSEAEVKCLRRGVGRLISGRNNESDVLECRGNGSQFAIYNSRASAFVDPHYSKTASECGQAIDEATDKYVCATSASGKAAVYDYSTSKFVDQYYMKTLGQCFQSTRAIKKNIICVVGSNEKFARYDGARSQFLDSVYGLSLEDCIALVR